jgi:hypothetical protein
MNLKCNTPNSGGGCVGSLTSGSRQTAILNLQKHRQFSYSIVPGQAVQHSYLHFSKELITSEHATAEVQCELP